jgi:hypothetical protein
MLDANENDLATSNPFFKEMDYTVQIDEKWFYMTKKKNNYYLLRYRAEHELYWKVMFLIDVAKPRYEGGVFTFDGKIGMWAFGKETWVVKKRKHIPKGTMKVKLLKVTREVMSYYTNSIYGITSHATEFECKNSIKWVADMT